MIIASGDGNNGRKNSSEMNKNTGQDDGQEEEDSVNLGAGAPRSQNIVIKNLLFNNYNQAKRSYRQNKNDLQTGKSTERDNGQFRHPKDRQNEPNIG